MIRRIVGQLRTKHFMNNPACYIFLLILLGINAPGLNAQTERIPGLIGFKAEKIGDDAHIEWTMEEKFLMCDFVVERSLDNADFSAVGLVSAGGNMKSHDTYGFVDENVVMYNAQTIFYRIVQIGFRGENYHSQSVGISQLESKGIIVDYFPNPEKQGVTNIAYLAKGEGELLMQITNSSGQVVFYDELQKGPGFQVTEVKGLIAGTYFIKMFDDVYAVSEEMTVK